ncbi:MAG: integrase [Gammaproteobacteria bacterium CG11_big_fil_rev_8_21_14_0_20_46_22]|nr:MAG: integrase [Gammaproteobacteria bacterium CG11_big_fil_rev_8_21_14_0_20_46_22]
MSHKIPRPLFDTTEFTEDTQCPAEFNAQDFSAAKQFLIAYKGSYATFNTYRREVERLMQWSWLVAKKSLRELRRQNLEKYIQFCQKPPEKWIGLKKPPRFIEKDGARVPNPTWRPFVVSVSKSAHRKGEKPQIKDFEFSKTAIKDLFAVLSTFYNFLIAEDYTEVNPVLQIRQKSRFIQKTQTATKIRRLSQLQWNYVIRAAEDMAERNPEQHMRTLFIMNVLFAMYLRISELAASDRWTPKMCDFYRDHDNHWWFVTVGKGNKKRQIAVSDAMLKALKQWRKYLKLSLLPSPADQSPLLPKTKGKGPITSTTYIRRLVQSCFDVAIIQLHNDKKKEEAESLLDATVHWLRHTGISEDVKTRPREHVRDDAGHSSSAITDHYIDIELHERHASAKNKPVKLENKKPND